MLCDGVMMYGEIEQHTNLIPSDTWCWNTTNGTGKWDRSVQGSVYDEIGEVENQHRRA